MAQQQISDGYHLSFSIGKSLWDDLVGSALPVKVREGTFDLGRNLYQGVKQLQVREKVAALLEDREAPEALTKAKSAAADLWGNRREQVYKLIDELVHIEGEWGFEVDRDGTEFQYAPQRLGVDAHVKATATGKAYLLRNNVEIPFTIEKRLGATAALGDIKYDKDSRTITGEVMDPAIDFGDSIVSSLLNEAVANILGQQVQRFGRVPIIKQDQLDEMLAPAGGPLKMKMSVQDVRIEVSETELTLRVKFGFEQNQIEG